MPLIYFRPYGQVQDRGIGIGNHHHRFFVIPFFAGTVEGYLNNVALSRTNGCTGERWHRAAARALGFTDDQVALSAVAEVEFIGHGFAFLYSSKVVQRVCKDHYGCLTEAGRRVETAWIVDQVGRQFAVHVLGRITRLLASTGGQQEQSQQGGAQGQESNVQLAVGPHGMYQMKVKFRNFSAGPL